MARYNVHPAQSGGKYHDMKIYKDRQETEKGAIGWPSTKAEDLDH